MKKLKGILSQSMLFQVYKALVESNLRYADVVCGSLSNTKITALQRLQNRAFEIIQASKIKDSLIRPTLCIDQLLNKTDLQILRLKLEFSKESFIYTSLKTWNSIPRHMRETGTLNRFKVIC